MLLGLKLKPQGLAVSNGLRDTTAEPAGVVGVLLAVDAVAGDGGGENPGVSLVGPRETEGGTANQHEGQQEFLRTFHQKKGGLKKCLLDSLFGNGDSPHGHSENAVKLE
jgi:hypothetical protein